jgi:lysophospholipase L1-like esterase
MQGGRGWALRLWTAQLLPSTALVAYSALRIAADSHSERAGLKSSLFLVILVIGVSWTVAVLGMLMTSRGRDWIAGSWRNWGLAGASIIVALVLLDIGLTLGNVVPTIEETRAHSLSYTPGLHMVRLIPQDVAVGDADGIHINRRGFRGPGVERRRKPGTYRIVFLGGSQVFDYTGGGWPGLVGEELLRRGMSVEIINAGVPSHNSNDAVHKLATDLWMLAPDIIFVCNTWNDVKHYARMATGEPYRRLPPLEPTPHNIDWRLYPQGIDKLLSVSSLYRTIRTGLLSVLVSDEGTWRSFGPEDVPRKPVDWASLDAPGPRQFALNLRLILTISREIGANLMLCRQGRLLVGAGSSGMPVEEYVSRNTGLSMQEMDAAFATNDQIISMLMDEPDVDVVDIQAVLRGAEEYFHDGIHFSPSGSLMVSPVIADAIEKRLRGEALRESKSSNDRGVTKRD